MAGLDERVRVYPPVERGERRGEVAPEVGGGPARIVLFGWAYMVAPSVGAYWPGRVASA